LQKAPAAKTAGVTKTKAPAAKTAGVTKT